MSARHDRDAAMITTFLSSIAGEEEEKEEEEEEEEAEEEAEEYGMGEQE